MVRIPTHRPPTHPGEMLLEEFLMPMGLTQRELADADHVPYQHSPPISQILWHVGGVLDEFAITLGPLSGSEIRGEGIGGDTAVFPRCQLRPGVLKNAHPRCLHLPGQRRPDRPRPNPHRR